MSFNIRDIHPEWFPNHTDVYRRFPVSKHYNLNAPRRLQAINRHRRRASLPVIHKNGKRDQY